MKKLIHVELTQPLLMHIPDIAFTTVPYCWGSYKQLKMSVLTLKNRENMTPRPLLIWVCGGGFEQLDKDIWMPEMQYFVRRGYVVASIEYRTYNIAPFPALIEDAKSAVRYLRAHAADYGIDPARIAMMGESAGGYVACMAGVTGDTREFDTGDYLDQSSAIQAVVNFYGRTRQEMGWHEKVAQGRTRNTTELLMNGRPDAIPEAYEKASPSSYLRPGLPPFLLLHGTGDKAVPILQNDLFYEDLIKMGVDADYYQVEGAGHGAPEFYQPEVKQLILDFLNAHLA